MYKFDIADNMDSGDKMFCHCESMNIWKHIQRDNEENQEVGVEQIQQRDRKTAAAKKKNKREIAKAKI